MDEDDQRRRLISDTLTLTRMDLSSSLHIDLCASQSGQLDINQGYIQKVLKQNLSFQTNTNSFNHFNSRGQFGIKLKKPPTGESEFKYTWPFYFRIRNIMTAAHNKQQLKVSEFEQFQSLFKLNQNQIKMVNDPDPVVLQIIRYAVFNKQEIPPNLVRAINQMAKTNLVKNWEKAADVFHKLFMFDLVCEIFQPPLDIYIELIDSGQINPSQQELNEVLTRNQFLFKSLCNDKEFYSTPSQKKRLIFNQFPYLLDIFTRIKQQSPSDYNFAGFKLYLSTITSFLQFHTEQYLLERYIPQVKCRYLKIKANLTSLEIQYLFTTLKSIKHMHKEDFKILYATKSNKNIITKQHKVKSWLKCWKVQELCANIFTKKDFHLTVRQMQQMGEQLNYQKLLCPEIIKCHLYIMMLREEAYNNQSFPKSLIKNISMVFRNIPDRMKRKQCCYLLILQYYKLMIQNPDKRNQIVQQYTFPEDEIDQLLDEGRLISLDLLLHEQYKKLTFQESKCETYLKIIKNVINETKNRVIRNKAFQLYTKLNKQNKFQTQDLNFCQFNITKDNTLVEFLQVEALNGRKISVDYIRNVIKILSDNHDPLVRKNCLSTLKYVVKNSKNGQFLPQNFEQGIIKFTIKLYSEQDISFQCKNQIIKLAIECTHLPGTYAAIDILVKFLLQVYLKSSSKSSLNVNSSYGVFKVFSNFRLKSEKNYENSKQFLESYGNQILKIVKKTFQPANKGYINILSSIVALAKNQVLLPSGLAQELTVIGLRSKKLVELVLLVLFLHLRNPKSKGLSQKSLVNVCQILKEDNYNQSIGIQILQRSFHKEQTMPSIAIKSIRQLIKSVKYQNNEHLCNFYKDYLQMLVLGTNYIKEEDAFQMKPYKN